MRKHQFFSRIFLSTFIFPIIVLMFAFSTEAAGEINARPTLTPDPRPTVKSGEPNSDDLIRGAFIELHIEPSYLNYWSEVQWQDSLGNWHLVDGWRGSSTNGVVKWFLGEKDLGTGAFRWLVYEPENFEFLAVSTPFYLPSKLNEVLVISVQINE